jgi:hypothetical protein
VLDPARLVAPPKRAPFEPGKARYSSGAWRIDWATLLKRVHDVDAVACPCGGRLKFVEVATQTDCTRERLRQFGPSTFAAPMVARAPVPTDDSTRPRPTPGDVASQQPDRGCRRRFTEPVASAGVRLEIGHNIT